MHNRWKLFPPFLELGSRGGAVDALHILLMMLGFGGDIVRDLKYGPTTALRVRELQAWLGIEADGKFGPATRAALAEERHIDVSAIWWVPQDGLTAWAMDGIIQGDWPTRA